MGEAKRRADKIKELKEKQTKGAKVARAAAYNEMRDAALRSLDPGVMERFLLFWGNPCPYPLMRRDVYYAMAHIARLQIKHFTHEEKLISAQWLVENGDEYKLPNGITFENGELKGTEYE
jgi:hypothetical protein